MRQEGERTEAFSGAVDPCLGPPAHAGKGTHQRVGRGRRNPRNPGEHTPNSADEQRRNNAVQTGGTLRGTHPRGGILTEQQERTDHTEHVEERGKVQGGALAEGAGTHRNSDGVGGVVHTGNVDRGNEGATG